MTKQTTIEPVYLSIPRTVILILCGGAVAGALLSVTASMLYTGGAHRVMLSYLVAFAFALSLSLGSLFFVLVQHLTRAGWGVLVRRPAEIFALNVITVAVLFVPLAFSVLGNSASLYPWATANVDELTQSKQNWLHPGLFLLRAAVFFAVWAWIAWFYFHRSRHHDLAGGEDDTRQMEWWAGPAMFVFGITLTYASFDFLMSLDPHWYSTIFGVYYFAGCAVGGFSILLLSVLLLEKYGILTPIISDEHRRDLGRLLFAFVFFWGYIAFSQYMLLWYANMPETTRWFVVRGASMAEGFGNSWGRLLVFLLFGHFIIPFFGILSRHVKSNKHAMIFWTVWLLVMHYFDLYWLVMPELGPHFTIGLPELGTLLFVSCTYLIGASLIATRTSLLPIGDPRLGASIAVTAAY
ncbi:quinol:cytochrome C oxidoreductase [Novipirellula aureliae]|nr:quinol:cytochrome C oxidoreductase [Novipirellula aureliae]